MNILIKAVASDLWVVYDTDLPVDTQEVGSGSTEAEAEDLANAYEGSQIKQDG